MLHDRGSGAENRIVEAVDGADATNAFEVVTDVARGDQDPRHPLAPNAKGDELSTLLVDALCDVTPSEVSGLRRPHARVRHDQDEVVDHRPIPDVQGALALLDPGASEGMKRPIFLGSEFVASFLRDGQLLNEDVALWDHPLRSGEFDDRAEGRHLVANGATANGSA